MQKLRPHGQFNAARPDRDDEDGAPKEPAAILVLPTNGRADIAAGIQRLDDGGAWAVFYDPTPEGECLRDKWFDQIESERNAEDSD